MHLECLTGSLVAGEEFLFDVWLTGGCPQRRHPIFMGHDVVYLGAGLDDARPADHARDTVAAFPARVLFAVERRRASVGPRELFGTVVGGVDDDGVVGD